MPDASFNYIYTLNVLEHIEDDAAALRSLHAKLTDGGKLLIYVPAFPVLYTSMDAKVGHVRRYTRDTLMTRVTAAGFQHRSRRLRRFDRFFRDAAVQAQRQQETAT